VADDGNDFLNPDEIESLLNSAREKPEILSEPEDEAESAPPQQKQKPGGRDEQDPGDEEDRFRNLDEEEPSPARRTSSGRQGVMGPEKILDQAQAHLGQAMAGSIQMPDPTAKFGPPSAYAFAQFEGGHRPNRAKQPLEILQDVELDLRIELGRTELLIEEVVALKEGSVVTLDKLAGDPVDILVNGRLIARGEVLVLNDNFCVRVAEILTPDV
jgi:flagellar motor switch protein FliN/FliY